MQTTKVKEADLNKYTYDMIHHAVYSYPNEVAGVLHINGVDVPQNASYKTLHAMTLKAIASSTAFRNDFKGLLHAIAMDNQYHDYKTASNFSNDDGSTSNIGSSENTTDQSYFQQVFNPKTLDALLTSGLTIVSAEINKGGNSTIQDKVNTMPNTAPTPPPPAKTSSKGVIIGVIAIVAITAVLLFIVK